MSQSGDTPPGEPQQPPQQPGPPPPPQWGQPAPPPPAYGQQPQPPSYGQPYGQAPQQPYGAPAPAPGYPAAPAPPYAHWIKRVGSSVLDGIFVSLSAIPAYALIGIGVSVGTKDYQTYTDQFGYTQTTGEWNDGGTPLLVIGIVLLLVPLGFFIWNTCVRQGRTGKSLGKQIVHTTLIYEATGQPIGGGMAFVRYLCHIIDALPCYLGYLWPLWDAKRQTFADKIVKTIVVDDRS